MKIDKWHRLSEKKLLECRIKDLDLHINNTGLAPLIQQLYTELAQKNLIFRPACFLADEWFCPVGVPAIGIPFFLAHSRLRRLEKAMVLECEGDTKKEFMKLIRHEAGHAYSYAFELYKKKKWQKLFGLASQEYKDTYRPRPYSKAYVNHLDNWYAQSHPDEDFAETFAVWLTPQSRWKTKYRGWKVMEKLEYVDDLMSSLKKKKAKKIVTFDPAEYSGLNIKLKTYYREKKKLYEEEFPDFYDKDLLKLFVTKDTSHSPEKAYRYLQRHKAVIITSVAKWTREKKYTVDKLMQDLITRCRELNLYLKQDDNHIDHQVVSYITTLVNCYLFTGKFKRSK